MKATFKLTQPCLPCPEAKAFQQYTARLTYLNSMPLLTQTFISAVQRMLYFRHKTRQMRFRGTDDSWDLLFEVQAILEHYSDLVVVPPGPSPDAQILAQMCEWPDGMAERWCAKKQDDTKMIALACELLVTKSSSVWTELYKQRQEEHMKWMREKVKFDPPRKGKDVGMVVERGGGMIRRGQGGVVVGGPGWIG